MKIEAGKYYKTRDGRKVGPAKKVFDRFEFDGTWSMCHESDGTYCGRKESDRGLDLIAEWTDGPVRTVTRREVVGGQYDGVIVRDRFGNGVPVEIKLTHMTSTELKAAAAVLLELAGALE